LFNEEVKELHALWDSGIGHMQEELERPLTSDGWHKLNMWSEWCMGNNTKESLAEEISVNKISDWSYNTYHSAIEGAYLDVKYNQKPTEEYINKAWETTKRQLALGGYRLAKLLEELYGDKKVIE
jgi:hypothetical protein